MSICDSSLLALACLTGIVGDFILQMLVRNNMGGITGWGLKTYFSRHGHFESMFIAGGMMTLFYIIYLYVLKLPVKWYYLIIYGVILDLIFRTFMLFPSLKGYYKYFNHIWSAIWAIIPMLIPLFVDKYIKT